MMKHLLFSLVTVLLLTGIFTNTFTSASVAATITVDSTSDTNDGVCGPPPEDCTLREAIHAVNAGLGKKIDFDPAVFPPGVLTTLILNSELPAITESGTTIDGSGAGVEIHGAGIIGDGIIFESGVGIALTNVTVRSIVVRYVQGSGINICGGTRFDGCNDPVSKVTVSHVTVNGNESRGIIIHGSDIDRANVQHVYSEGNDGPGINLDAYPGDINRPQVNDCTAVNNGSGIYITGDSILNAKLIDNTISRNTPGLGIYLYCQALIRPKITGNSVSENESTGINLYAGSTMLKPIVSDNHVVGHSGSGGGIVAGSSNFNGGQFNDNVVMNNLSGMYIYGRSTLVKVKLQNNGVVNNTGEGIHIGSSSNSQVKNNIVSDNGNNGILIHGSGEGNKIQGNRVIGNQNNGINVQENQTNNQIKFNDARGNDGYDLFDENSACDSNTWIRNAFVTRNQDCIQ